MAPDDLNAPLGQTKRKTLPKLPVAGPQILAGVLALSGVVVVGWAAFVNDPLGGEPVAVVATNPLAAVQANQNGDSDGEHHDRYDGPVVVKTPDSASASSSTAKTDTPPAGSQTVTIIDGSSGARRDVIIPGKDGGGAAAKAAVDKGLLEQSRHGMIPKIGANGARPAALYAKPRELPPDRKNDPRIAIVISGLGISASGTADALHKLPAPVTLALAPYGSDLEKLAEHARAENHEVLLQVPMEPFDYPDNDPGPQTLLTSLSGEENIDRMHWLMSRFRGYVGLVSTMGSRFTATEQAMAPVIAETAKRGLIYMDDGASSRSVAGQVAGGRGLPFVKTDVVLDAVPTPAEIDRALARLEAIARNSGSAVGLAAAQPGTIARIAAWAKSVEGRGFVLVPVTMIAAKAKSS
ncbi:MAG TPA: divergent polysaccharide deacetylase family protein [Pseudolabrys sp.]